MENINLKFVSTDRNTQDVSPEAANFSIKEELAKYYFEVINKFQDEMSDEDKQKIHARILAKLKSGKKLTAEELNYLRKYDPILYQRALRIQKIAENVENQLKHARSKQQANMIISQSIGGISDKDPDKEYIVAAINRVAMEFKKSGAYRRLPDTDEDVFKKKNKRKPGCEFESDSDDDSDENLFEWTPLQEIIDSLPKFNVNA